MNVNQFTITIETIFQDFLLILLSPIPYLSPPLFSSFLRALKAFLYSLKVLQQKPNVLLCLCILRMRLPWLSNEFTYVCMYVCMYVWIYECILCAKFSSVKRNHKIVNKTAVDTLIMHRIKQKQKQKRNKKLELLLEQLKEDWRKRNKKKSGSKTQERKFYRQW